MTASELTPCGSKAADFPASPIVVKKVLSDQTGRDGSSPGQEDYRFLFYFFSSGHFSKLNVFQCVVCLQSVSRALKWLIVDNFVYFLYLILMERICWPLMCHSWKPDFYGPNFFFFMAHVLTLADNSGLQIFHWLFYALWVSHYSLFQLSPLFWPLGKTLGPWPSLGLRLWLPPLPLSQGSHLALLPSALQIFLQHPSAK